MTALPLGSTTRVSRRMGAGVWLELLGLDVEKEDTEEDEEGDQVPSSAAERWRIWNWCPCKWKGWRPESRLLSTSWTMELWERIKGWV